ncbi:MAG TPA: peptidase M55 [Bacteroidales bacterium]|nr:peptidase M55 [Bacteroidales bacterium]
MKKAMVRFIFSALTLLLVSLVHGQDSDFKVYISADMEGITGLVDREQVTSTGLDFNIARRWMTLEVNAAIEGAFEAGATKVVVNDSHGDMRNLLPDVLDQRAFLISGTSKPLGMMQGIDSTFDAVMFIGYHAMAGTVDAVLDHTYAGAVVFSIHVNGVEMSEGSLNAMLAGYFGVPVVFISGDRAACEELRRITGQNIPFVAVKQGIGRYAAKNIPMESARIQIRQEVKNALQNIQVQPVEVSRPISIELTFLRTHSADMAALIPGVERTTARSVTIRPDNIIEGFKFLRALIAVGRY